MLAGTPRGQPRVGPGRRHPVPAAVDIGRFTRRVRAQHVQRNGKPGQHIEDLLHVARPVEPRHRHQGVLLAHPERALVGIGQVRLEIDFRHGPVHRAKAREGLRRATGHGDRFLAAVHIAPRSHEPVLVWIVRVQFLHVEVGIVRAPARHGPRNVRVVPDEDQRQPWEGDAGHIDIRPVQVHLTGGLRRGRRGLKRHGRAAHKQRKTRRASRRTHNRRVTAHLRGEAALLRHPQQLGLFLLALARHGRVQRGQACGTCRPLPFRRRARFVVRDGGGREWVVDGIQAVELVPAKGLQLFEIPHFVTATLAEQPEHDMHKPDRIERGPGRQVASFEFERQQSGVGGNLVDVGIHTGGVRSEHRLNVRRQSVKLRPKFLAGVVVAADGVVEAEVLFAIDCGERAACVAPVEVHLGEAVLRDGIAHGVVEAVGGLFGDMRHAVGVAVQHDGFPAGVNLLPRHAPSAPRQRGGHNQRRRRDFPVLRHVPSSRQEERKSRRATAR